MSRQEPGTPVGRRPPVLVRLVTRLVIAQAVAAVAVGLPFSRRHLPSILITLTLVAALCALAVVVRLGTRGAWMAAVGFEAAFVVYGLSRFMFARYLGGTLFAIITAGALLHPAVARAYGAAPAAADEQVTGDLGLGEAAGDSFGGEAVG